jgi:hypothetical protein
MRMFLQYRISDIAERNSIALRALRGMISESNDARLLHSADPKQ